MVPRLFGLIVNAVVLAAGCGLAEPLAAPWIPEAGRAD